MASTASQQGTASELWAQWMRPRDVSAVLMIIGGDVVQKALAQTTGCLYTPVVFSFGWVAYSFIALINIIGDGRLLPTPDYPVKVFNLRSGYHRQNNNWVIGRILRDQEAIMGRLRPDFDQGIRISIWNAEENTNGRTKHSYRRIHGLGVLVMVVQLFVAAIPMFLHRRWGVLLLTAAGNTLAVATGSLPQWTVEKLPNRQKEGRKAHAFALTTGNGSRDIVVILGLDNPCLDLEELSAAPSPRNRRPWEKFRSYRGDAEKGGGQSGKSQNYRFSTPADAGTSRSLRSRSWELMATRLLYGLTLGFWLTRAACIVLSLLWVALLICVSALEQDSWYVLAVGLIGMFQNGVLAAMEIPSEARNLPLKQREVIIAHKVMDGIMDLHATYGIGRPLLNEYFPAKLRKNEHDWWNGNTDAYDEERSSQAWLRGEPRTPRHMHDLQGLVSDFGEFWPEESKAARRLRELKEKDSGAGSITVVPAPRGVARLSLAN